MKSMNNAPLFAIVVIYPATKPFEAGSYVDSLFRVIK